MNDNNEIVVSRRKFLAGSLAGIGLLTGLPDWFVKDARAAEHERYLEMPKRVGPGDRIVVGVIGPGGTKGGYRQGLGDTRAIGSKMGVQVIAACDVDRQHRDEAAAIFGPDTKKYDDYRELIANREIDAVVIG